MILNDLLIFIILFFPIIIKFISKTSTSNRIVFRYYLLLITYHLFSTFYGYLCLNVPPTTSDLNYLLGEFKYLWIICAASLASFEIFDEYFRKFIRFGIWFIFLICLLEYINPLNFASFIGRYYSSENHLNAMLGHYNRILVTGSDPNIGASIVAYFFIYKFCSVLHYGKLQDLMFSIMLLFCCMLTSSRTVLIGIISSILFLLLINKKIKFYIKISVLLLFAIVLILMIPHFTYLFTGISAVFTDVGSSSLNYRFVVWEYLSSLIYQSPYIGWGVAQSIKIALDVNVDGEWIFTLFRYGMIGLILYLMINILLVFKTKFKILNFRLIFYSDYVKAIFILSLFIIFTNNFFMGKQLFQTYIILLTILHNGIYSCNTNTMIRY